MILATAALCLSLNVYMEARSEPFVGQLAVAQVTLNRASHRNENVCNEVVKSAQFSWTKGKVQLRHGKFYLLDRFKPSEKDKAWLLAKGIAMVAMKRLGPDVTQGATFYHAVYVNPTWNRKMLLVRTIGRHKFYRII